MRELIRSYADQAAWDHASQVVVMAGYLERCHEAMSIPNPQDFAQYLAEAVAGESDEDDDPDYDSQGNLLPGVDHA